MKKQATITEKSGFTLIELLVAMTITSMIVLTLLDIVNQSAGTYTSTMRSVNSISEARAFMCFIEREFSTRLPGTPIIVQAGDGNEPSSSDKLGLIRTISIAEQNPKAPGDLGTSAYYVAFSKGPGNTPVPRLYRKMLDPSQTQKLLETQNNSLLLNPDIENDEIIFDNILSFKAQGKIINPDTGELEDWTQLSTQPITAVELKIRFIDESHARRLEKPDDWNRLATAPRANELDFIRDFTRTISVTK